MKNCCSLLLFIVFSLIPGLLFPQESEVSSNKQFGNNAYYFSLNALTINRLKMGYEREFNNKKSALVFYGILHAEESGGRNKSKFIGYQGEIHYKLNLLNSNISKNGDLLINWAFYGHFDYTEIYYTGDGTTCIRWTTSWSGSTRCREFEKVPLEDFIKGKEGGILFSTKYIYKQKLTMLMYFGGGLRIADVRTQDDNDHMWGSINGMGYNGVLPKLGWEFGFVF